VFVDSKMKEANKIKREKSERSFSTKAIFDKTTCVLVTYERINEKQQKS
jgi:hypothetical protein